MLDEWARESIKVSESKGCFFHKHVKNHKEMFEECEAFQGWVRCEQKDVEGLNNRIEYHVSKLERLNHIRDNSPDKPWDRFFALPTKDNFPTIYEFLEQNNINYLNLSKLAWDLVGYKSLIDEGEKLRDVLIWKNDNHPNIEGNKFMAEKIYEKILNDNIINIKDIYK